MDKRKLPRPFVSLGWLFSGVFNSKALFYKDLRQGVVAKNKFNYFFTWTADVQVTVLKFEEEYEYKYLTNGIWPQNGALLSPGKIAPAPPNPRELVVPADARSGGALSRLGAGSGKEVIGPV